MILKRIIGLPAISVLVLAGACRWQSSTSTTETTGASGSTTGAGFTAQCSGDFPDWITANPPVADATGDVNPSEPGIQKAFQLAQAYPLGTPIFVTNSSGNTVVDHWDPPSPNGDSPWRAFTNLSNAAQRTSYLNALKDYFLTGMSNPGIDFDAVRNNADLGTRHWFHVPMMTAAGAKRREPFHGVTSERGLRPSEQTHWLNGTTLLRSVAIGYYNSLGAYTIGQSFPSYDLSKTDPTKAKFIDGAFVFKLLFAEYVPTRIKAPDPLANSPKWFVQDPNNPGNPPTEMRLLQVDVAVKDDHLASTTGWAFATYVYDESLAATEPNPWRRLTPVGIQWGNDPTVTAATGFPTLAETWINPSMPVAFTGHLGRAGRLIGPVDNPVSSCLSCHSTAEVDPSQAGNAANYMGAAAIPPSGAMCPSNTDQMQWFRNLASGPGGAQAFGAGLMCPVNGSAPGLVAVDYSLQLQEGFQSVFGYRNPNPCFDSAKQHHDEAGDSEASNRAKRRLTRESPASRERMARNIEPVKAKTESHWIGPTPGEQNQR
jgi:hypothetical protein